MAPRQTRACRAAMPHLREHASATPTARLALLSLLLCSLTSSTALTVALGPSVCLRAATPLRAAGQSVGEGESETQKCQVLGRSFRTQYAESTIKFAPPLDLVQAVSCNTSCVRRHCGVHAGLVQVTASPSPAINHHLGNKW